MHILIVSDIHSNIVALEAVLAHAGEFDQIWCIGDTIGYGPQPNECIEKMHELAQYAISGNHDLACIGAVNLEDFNPDARVANQWNGRQLTHNNLDWIEGLDDHITRLNSDMFQDFSLAHGSPRDPVWEYLLSVEQALANFDHPNFPTKVCFIGHSHVPIYFRKDYERGCQLLRPDNGTRIDLSGETRFIINPGSVGQPRDGDRRAAYAMLDLDTYTLRFYRVDYEIGKTQKQMREFGLPVALIRRLQFGL